MKEERLAGVERIGSTADYWVDVDADECKVVLVPKNTTPTWLSPRVADVAVQKIRHHDAAAAIRTAMSYLDLRGEER